jgi:hypothetical protein
VLGLLKPPGEGGAVAGALAALTSDSKSPFLARCAAAGALGKLDFSGASGAANDAVAALTRLARDAVVAENSPAVVLRLRERLQSVRAGLDAPTENASGEAKVMAGTLKQEVDVLIKLDPAGPAEVISAAVSAARANLDKLLQKPPK